MFPNSHQYPALRECNYGSFDLAMYQDNGKWKFRRSGPGGTHAKVSVKKVISPIHKQASREEPQFSVQQMVSSLFYIMI